MKKIFLIVIACILLGIVVGIEYSKFSTLSWCVNQGFKFLEVKGVELNIDKGLLISGILRYKNNINKFLEDKNASLLSNTGS